VVNGSTTTPWAYDASSNSLTWQGALDVGGLFVSPSPAPFGYVPLSAFFAPLGCPSNCDDGGFLFNVPSFTYNGASYSSLILSVNGTIEAGTASGLAASATNRDMPAANLPNNIMAPYWRDLNLSAGGNWYLGVLGDGVQTWLIAEWENVPEFGNPDAATFQVWIEIDGSPGGPNVHFVYANIDDPTGNFTVGAENADATNGYAYYYNGSGTPPVPGVDLLVETLDGGSATLGFQVTTDGCGKVVNEAGLENGGDTAQAIAVTTCP
jgi:hypothetical protein